MSSTRKGRRGVTPNINFRPTEPTRFLKVDKTQTRKDTKNTNDEGSNYARTNSRNELGTNLKYT